MINKDIIQSYVLTSAKYDFSVYEKRILLKIVESFQHLLKGKKLDKNIKIDEDLWGDFYVTTPLSYFLSGPKDKNYSLVKDALRGLESRKMEYEDKDGNWGILRLIQSPNIKNYKMVSFRIDNKISEVLFDFSKGFTKYEFKVAMEMRSVFALRFYELMSNQKHKISYSVERLKEMFQVQDKYKQTGHFVDKVIERAKKELDKKAPWSFKYAYIKKGRKITGFVFTPIYIPENRDKELEEKDLNKRLSVSWTIPTRVLDYLRNKYEFTDKEIKNNYKILVPASMDGTIDIMDFLAKKYVEAMIKTNPKGWLLSAMKKEYAYKKANR